MIDSRKKTADWPRSFIPKTIMALLGLDTLRLLEDGTGNQEKISEMAYPFYDSCSTYGKSNFINNFILRKTPAYYFPIDCKYIDVVKHFNDALKIVPSVKSPKILYLGCKSLEDANLNGISKPSTSYIMGNICSSGTIIEILLEPGMKCISVADILPEDRRKEYLLNAVLLPPCEYEVVGEGFANKLGIFNLGKKFKVYRVKITRQLDIIELLKDAMENPTAAFVEGLCSDKKRTEFEEAKKYIESFRI